MKLEPFQELSAEQQWAMLIGATVRNGLEYLHAGPDGIIPQSAMPELNRRLRFKIMQTVHCLMNFEKSGCESAIQMAVQAINSYCEVPEFLPVEQQALDEGGPADPEQFKQAQTERLHWYKTGQMP
jgi:hypothetical protein